MQTLTATQTKKDFYTILKATKMVEVKHKEGNSVMLSKVKFDKMGTEFIKFEIEKTLASGQKILSGKAVESRIAKVLKARLV